jgi:hypothetical protein
MSHVHDAIRAAIATLVASLVWPLVLRMLFPRLTNE